MKIEALHIGMSVRHPQYGLGTVRTISEVTAEIQFNDGRRTVEPDAAGLEPAEPQAAVSGLAMPLKQFVAETLDAALRKLGFERRRQWGGAGGFLFQSPAGRAVSPRRVWRRV